MKSITLPPITSPEETAKIGQRLDAFQRVAAADSERRKRIRELRRLRRIVAMAVAKGFIPPTR